MHRRLGTGVGLLGIVTVTTALTLLVGACKAQNWRKQRYGLLGVITVMSILAVLVGACKAQNWRKQKADSEAAANEGGLPRIASSADAVGGVPLAFDVDEKTGRPKATVMLRLDYFPDPKPGTASLPACYPAFPADFELGLIQCDGRPDSRKPLFASNVEQDCYTDPKRGRVPASAPLAMPGCKHAQLMPHAFEPALRLDVEVRDVN